MRWIGSLPLRWLLPCSVFVLALPCIALIIYLPLKSGNEQIKSYHRQFLHHQLTNLQLEISEHLHDTDLSGISRQIALFATLPQVQRVVLLDDHDQILLTSNPGWRGRPISMLSTQFDPALMQQVRSQNRGVIVASSTEHLLVYYPAQLPAVRDTIRQGLRGGLYVEYDLTGPLQHQWRAAWAQGSLVALIASGIALLLVLLLRRYIEQPVQSLILATQAMAQGNFRPHFAPMRGVEFVRLNHAFRRLGIRLARSRRQLHAQQSRWLSHISTMPLGCIEWDLEFRVTVWNPAAEDIFGYSADEAIGRHAKDLIIPPDVADQIVVVWTDLIRRRGGARSNNANLTKEGRIILCDWYNSVLTNAAGEVIGAASLIEDVTQRETDRQALVDSTLRYQTLFDSVADGVIVLDDQAGIQSLNRAAERIFGYSESEMVGQSIERLMPQFTTLIKQRVAQLDDEQATNQGRRHELLGRRQDGSSMTLQIESMSMEFKGRALFSVTVQDISERKLNEARIERLAFYDPLTELPNRMLFMDRLQQGIAHARRNRKNGAVLFIDLDNFKMINDSLGHPVGDQLLRHLSITFRNIIRAEDAVARFGGDEFLMLLNDLSGEREQAVNEALRVAEKILRQFDTPCMVLGHELRVTPSIGVTLFPADSAQGDDLIQQADTAMYGAKAGGRNRVQFYLPSMAIAARNRHQLENELRAALQQEQFCLYYQPKVDLHSGAITGFEALLRWIHPQRGVVAPNDFIPVLEESGLILKVGEWVIEQICRDLNEWRSAGLLGAEQTIAFNVSARQFHQPDFIHKIKQITEQQQVDPALLECELTESLLLQDIEEAITKMAFLRALGMRIAIDDFGTGYSSLAYLKVLPVDVLKIDRSFIKDVPDGRKDAAIVETILTIAHQFGFEVVAEGVETEAQAQFLRERGCDSYQGYLCTAPLPPQALFARFGKHISKARSAG